MIPTHDSLHQSRLIVVVININCNSSTDPGDIVGVGGNWLQGGPFTVTRYERCCRQKLRGLEAGLRTAEKKKDNEKEQEKQEQEQEKKENR